MFVPDATFREGRSHFAIRFARLVEEKHDKVKRSKTKTVRTAWRQLGVAFGKFTYGVVEYRASNSAFLPRFPLSTESSMNTHTRVEERRESK
ncbi:hypothetical protein [Paenibacillus polymyxa]|uniref:hypothetical protein n=1 Tax=Paenibacillus polymyxa TaxID=1406 RepID=UPI00046E6A1B|nr:hypothetical protein [Paenibacillus polymyxa]